MIYVILEYGDGVCIYIYIYPGTNIYQETRIQQTPLKSVTKYYISILVYWTHIIPWLLYVK